MTARIYKPARNAMQSGKGKQDLWYLEYEPEQKRTADPLMGWTSSGDMKQQLRLVFETREEAVAYAERNAIAYRVAPEAIVRPQRKTYADNFRWGRTDNWTH
ncbi:ETC complex I subunit [soil metagenome]